jgi:Domain of unknown function (DUF397)
VSNGIWRKSSFSGENGTCVEVAFRGPAVGVRDSKNVGSGQLAVPAAGWVAFVNAVKR